MKAHRESCPVETRLGTESTFPRSRCRPPGARRSITVLVVIAALWQAPSALATEHCVGAAPACFATLQEAVDASDDGDRIELEAGTFDGGVTVNVDVEIVGQGPGSTTISGGGPVLTIGKFRARHEPEVQIEGVTIRDGLTRSSPMSDEFTGEPGVIAAGGGILILPDKRFKGKAKLTVRDSVIADNDVAPEDTVPSGNAQCPGGPCPFAQAEGGGIDSWGRLTLVDSEVRDNDVGSASGLSDLASDAVGGGVTSRSNSLILRNTQVDGNEATAVAPNGRFAEGGGIYTVGRGVLELSGSSVSMNRAVLDTELAHGVHSFAIGGGLQVGPDAGSIEISDSHIDENLAAMTNGRNAAHAYSGGMNVVTAGSAFQMTDSTVSGNTVHATAANGDHGNAVVDSGGATLLGRVVGSTISRNVATAEAAGGDATASSGGALMFGTMTESEVSDNTLSAFSPEGQATAGGGGLSVDFEPLTLRDSDVAENTVEASGNAGTSRGGGLYNGNLFSTGALLKLVDSDVSDNEALGNGTKVQGGGIFARNRPVRSIDGDVSGNTPDDCFGC